MLASLTVSLAYILLAVLVVGFIFYAVASRTAARPELGSEIELAPNANAQLLLRRLIDAGATVERFELVQPSLHRIFLDTVGASGVEAGMSGHG